MKINDVSQRQLERFVNFMVHCSLGEDINKPWPALKTAAWWPSQLPFKINTGYPIAPSQRSLLVRNVIRY